jgi:hypothetical protein
VVNNTDQKINDVMVLNKYSDIYNDKCIWGSLEAGQTSDGRYATFNTGFGTAGVDWG